MLELEKPDLPDETDLRAVPVVWYVHRLMGQPAWVQGSVLPRRLAPATVTMNGNSVEIRYLDPDGPARWEPPSDKQVVKNIDLKQPARLGLVRLFVKPDVIAPDDVPLILELSRALAEPYPACIGAAEERLRAVENAKSQEAARAIEEAKRAEQQLDGNITRERLFRIGITVAAIVAVLVLASFLTAVDPNLPSPSP
jgi:hypothetical protein